MTGAEIDRIIHAWLALHPAVHGFHHHDSRHTRGGWPDWVFLGEHGILFREIKGSNDKLSRDQREIGRLLSLADCDWEVWGPRDVASGGRAFKQLEEIT